MRSWQWRRTGMVALAVIALCGVATGSAYAGDDSAPDGAKNYIEDGRMTRGFALIAYPAEYGNSGIMTFLVNNRDIVFQKDLGDDTRAIAGEITEYAPDKTWEPVTEPES